MKLRASSRRRRMPVGGLKYNGWAHFVSRFLTERGRAQFSDYSRPVEFLFNFAGRYQQLEGPQALFQLEPQDNYGFDTGDIGEETIRPSLFDISCVIVRDILHISFQWPGFLSDNRHRQIREWASNTERSLTEAVQELQRQPRAWRLQCSRFWSILRWPTSLMG